MLKIDRLPGNVIYFERLKFPQEKDRFGHVFVNYRQFIKLAIKKSDGEFRGEIKAVFAKVPIDEVEKKKKKKNIFIMLIYFSLEM